MSYKSFKRVLGESNLERKCLWWFGVCLVLMLGLSFYWYSNQISSRVFDQDRKLASELVRTGWYEECFLKWGRKPIAGEYDRSLGVGSIDPEEDVDELTLQWFKRGGQSLGQPFELYAIYPPNDNGVQKNPPTNAEEEEILRYFLANPPQAAEGDSADKKFREQSVLDADGHWTYRYYQPLYAKRGCVGCHQVAGAGSPRTNLAENDLLAVARVEIDQQGTRRDLAKDNAFLCAMAVTIGFLSMFLLYFIIRYIIVKPVQHLRDVTNAVREGDIEQRAQIHTGDEFEELAASFNRMLRRLLRQQDALQDVNGELDAKVDQLAQANMRLFEMNRLKSDFLATMSHELRTPLNSILGFSEVLGGIDSLNDKQRRYVANISNSGRMLLEMINDILDLAKMESGKMDVRPSEFRVDTVVGAQCDLARPLSERKNIDLVFACPTGLPPMMQDQAKLQQALNNLLSNAIKFTPEGGRIAVRVSRSAEGVLVLQVEDSGIGISETDQALVFEKFRQGAAAAPTGDTMTREHSGTGLGLSIVREICRLLGGEVTLRSALGKGSTFTITLPWTLSTAGDLDAEMNQRVAELTRPVMPSLT
ncbi:Autoinducer 2 sensor kinase/phosphatase LuxQ [Pirellulimonas nuda]|uniref:histidine kinase n=1 Tax=Pirellulimonas nuda TaxID=2528009 RepID=A0A518D9C8_9BACT|nr:ATP-binding protein [Pirellulimonas nuda]QDU88089.1 Autoinducer 2 sensor kinase/phosphatase LuxQ [Pirellulimonas nuda]